MNHFIIRIPTTLNNISNISKYFIILVKKLKLSYICVLSLYNIIKKTQLMQLKYLFFI